MVVLGVKEFGGESDVGGDGAEAAGLQPRLITIAAGERLSELSLAAAINDRAVLRTDVVTLPHALRGIVAFPEGLQQLAVRQLRRVKDHTDPFGMTGSTAADLFVGGMGRVTAGIADRSRQHARNLPKESLGTPKTPHAEYGLDRPRGERRLQRSAIDEVPIVDRQGSAAPRECIGGTDEFGFATEE